MKLLLPLILLAVFASCGPSRYLECPRSVSLLFNADSLLASNTDTACPGMSHLGVVNAFCRKHNILSIKCPKCIEEEKPDTTCEWMHISTRNPGFVLNRKALAVQRNGVCIAHLQADKKPFPAHYHVGWCEGKELLLTRIVNEGRGR